MIEVERRLLASMTQIELRRPADPRARLCFYAYFAELADRFEDSFNPAVSISADDAELTRPAGLLLVAPSTVTRWAAAQ
jgi:hypothetical protein